MLPEPPALGSKGDDNLNPPDRDRLSRSPHPYQRSHHDINQDGRPSADQATSIFTQSIEPSPHISHQESPIGYFDADHRKRRKGSTSPSDSGTEADDEKGAFLTSLPAPPLRPRKGLKERYGTSSPLLTPSYLDDVARKTAFEASQTRRASFQSSVAADDEAIQLRQKFSRKRRAELIRRITETLLFGLVVYVAICRPLGLPPALCSYHLVDAVTASEVHQVLPALLAYITILLGLYGLYPVRIIIKNHNRNLSRNKAWHYIHIPAAFDPAVLIYPSVVPLVVALSVRPGSPHVLLLNTCLGLASIPRKIIPMNENVPWYSSIQWLLSAAPVLVSPAAQNHTQDINSSALTSPTLEIEVLICLYLLHQALMPVLAYMTTTSLLPAELQLLSICLINLLFFANSPQTIVLKALLWIGGLSLMILCRKILSWEVALARVPSWRFRRPQDQPRSRRPPGLLKVLDDSMNGRLSGLGLISADPYISDSDAPTVQPNTPKRKIKMLLPRIDTGSLEHAHDLVKVSSRKPFSAVTDEKNFGFSDDCSFEIPRALRTHQRRFTLPSYIDTPPGVIDQEGIQRKRSKRSQDIQAWSFRSLTQIQATLLSWVYAAYTYAVVALLIFIPISQYIGANALSGHEPVGWALGYLFGDLGWFRHLIHDLALDQWTFIPTPIEPKQIVSMRADRLDHAVGSANVRLLMCFYCLSIIAAGLAVVFRLSSVADVDTRRKVFHGMMVAMFLPTIFVDPAFVSLALALILAIFLLLDLFRASQLPPLSRPLTYFLAPYVDGRDHAGPVIVSHIFLLIGCAIPLWLSLGATERKEDSRWQGWDVQTRDLSMVAGVICVGMGDAAASLIGRRFGRRRWPWSGGKSLEGSLAFALAVVCGLSFARAWLVFGGWAGDSGDTWVMTFYKAGMAGCGASLTEAVLTGGNDNVIVPVILWLLVRGLEM